jgi:hypothetical protein
MNITVNVQFKKVTSIRGALTAFERKINKKKTYKGSKSNFLIFTLLKHTNWVQLRMIFQRCLYTPERIGLKGQCHEMVIEMIPWSSSLGLN